MKIAYISGSTIPSYTANSIQVMKMCQAMVAEGHQVILFTPKRQSKFYLEGVDIWHHYGVKLRFPIIWLPSPGRLGKLLYANNAVRQCSNANVDLIFTRNLTAALISAIKGYPVIFETHEVPSGLSGWLQFRLLLKNKNLKRIVVITHSLKQILLNTFSKNFSTELFVVAPDGVDLELFQKLPSQNEARQNLGLCFKGIIAGYSGHLYAGRGIGLILQLAKKFPNILFLLIGGLPKDVTMWKQKAYNNGLGNIIFTSFVPNSIIPLYLAACDILLMPYEKSVSVSGGGNTVRWMSPMKMFEYMASGCLIIASDLPVLREVLNYENAVLCRPDDINAWQCAIMHAVLDPVWRNEIGNRARIDVQKYSWQSRVRLCLNGIY